MIKVNVKNSQLGALHGVFLEIMGNKDLKKLLGKKMMKSVYAATKNHQIVEAAIKSAMEREKEIRKAAAAKNEAGEFILDDKGNFTYPPEILEDFSKDINALMNGASTMSLYRFPDNVLDSVVPILSGSQTEAVFDYLMEDDGDEEPSGNEQTEKQ